MSNQVAQMYVATGHPKPPAPTINAEDDFSFSWAKDRDNCIMLDGIKDNSYMNYFTTVFKNYSLVIITNSFLDQKHKKNERIEGQRGTNLKGESYAHGAYETRAMLMEILNVSTRYTERKKFVKKVREES
uniref:Uncharacterized protein n=1 Tax=Romanomermis culicivorax TaxID=13658 RepID=A0A915HRH2_ROMCU